MTQPGIEPRSPEPLVNSCNTQFKNQLWVASCLCLGSESIHTRHIIFIYKIADGYYSASKILFFMAGRLLKKKVGTNTKKINKQINKQINE